MGNSRFVLKQAHVRGTGSSDLTRYVAKSKLHEGREGKSARPLFTDRSDNLTSGEARKWLSITGGALLRADVLHYILSFEDAREYQLLGDEVDERRMEIARYVRRALADGFKKLAWLKCAGWQGCILIQIIRMFICCSTKTPSVERLKTSFVSQN